MLIMLDKRQRQVIAMSNSINLQHQSEVFRSLNVEGGSKTPYTDATQVSLQNNLIQNDPKLFKIVQIVKVCYGTVQKNILGDSVIH